MKCLKFLITSHINDNTSHISDKRALVQNPASSKELSSSVVRETLISCGKFIQFMDPKLLILGFP